MNRMIGCGDALTSSITDFSRFSNSPLTPAPACSRPRSSVRSDDVLQRRRHVARGDAQRKPFDDGRLARRPPRRSGSGCSGGGASGCRRSAGSRRRGRAPDRSRRCGRAPVRSIVNWSSAGVLPPGRPGPRRVARHGAERRLPASSAEPADDVEQAACAGPRRTMRVELGSSSRAPARDRSSLREQRQQQMAGAHARDAEVDRGERPGSLIKRGMRGDSAGVRALPVFSRSSARVRSRVSRGSVDFVVPQDARDIGVGHLRAA